MNLSLDERLKYLLLTPQLKEPAKDVEEAYASIIQFNLVQGLGSHGAFDPESFLPTILINSQTGLNESNIVHELVHTLLFSEGFPLYPSICTKFLTLSSVGFQVYLY